MARTSIKITYIPAQYRVRAEFTKADCLAHPSPPKDLLERAKAKLRRERKKGHVAFYRVFKTRLFTMWDVLRANDDPPETKVAITLATGAPPMPGINVEVKENADGLAYLTITADADEVANWRFRLFKLTIGKYLRRLGVKEVADAAHLHALWIRAGRGEKISDVPIYSIPSRISEGSNKNGYHIHSRANDGEIHLTVYRLRELMEIHRIEDIVNQIRAAARVLQLQTGKSYLILANYLAKELKSAYRGPEKFGLDLPMVFLAAIQRSMVPEASRLKKQSRQNVVAVTKSENTANSNDNPSVFRASLLKADDSYHPFDDFMTIVVSPDKLAASISVFDPKFFTSKLENSRENWDQLLAKKKLVSFSDELKNIMQMVTNKASLQNAVIAKGRVPVLGQEPYLVKVDPQSATGEELSDPAAMRERQQRVFVKKGQPVAVIAFAKPAVVGVDVFGKEIPGAAANLDRIAIGEGVEVKGNYFVASLDGVPTVQASSVSLSRALIIPTSVNMATGNVRFDGPVEIKGSVEEGATVDVNGDLVVRGMILGGTVKASGNILVEGGITTNDRGLIMCGKSLSANFIAQTRVICKNDVSVEKNILNSVVHAAGRIVVTAPESVVSGGEISCEKELICANLGRESGVVTSVRVGCDTKHEKIVTKIKSRLEKIQQAMKSIRNSQAYRDKADATLSTRQLKEKEKFSSQAERGQRILQKLETRLAGATAQVTLNTKARVVVNQVLSKNCNIVIGGKIIPVRNEMAGVELLGEKLRSGEYFKAIEEVAS